MEKLSLCGGFSTKDVIHRIMKTLLLHELSLNVTWSGKVTGKLGFQGSLISKAVIGSYFCLVYCFHTGYNHFCSYLLNYNEIITVYLNSAV